MTRSDGRQIDELRPIKITENYVSCADASFFVEVGKTRILCNATVEEKIPHWLKGEGKGWVTAEYSLLPRSTGSRVRRERGSISGRTQEIQRLIGRSLRGVVDLKAMGERSIVIDCDVIEADGGTRTASVFGGFLALGRTLQNIYKKDKPVIKDWLSATSVGIVKGEPILDLCYEEDLHAEVDMNLVMTGNSHFVEIQGTGEESTYSRAQLNSLLDLGEKGCKQLIDRQKEILGQLP